MSTIKGLGGLDKISDILIVLQEAFPKASAMVTNFTGALKNGEGIIAAFKGGLSGLWGVISAHPILAIIAALGLLYVAINKIKETLPNAENTAKWLKESSEEVKSIQSEVDNLNNELSTTQTRIDELLAKDSLTIVEQNELERLQKTNTELDRQIKLRERALKVAQTKNSTNFVQAVNAKRQDNFTNLASDNDTLMYSGLYEMATNKLGYDIGDANDIETYYKVITVAYEEAEKEYLQALNNGNEEEAERIKERKERYEAQMNEYISSLNEYKEQLGEYDYATLSDKAKEQLDYIQDVENKYFTTIGDSETVFDNIFNSDRFAKAKEAISELDEVTSATLRTLYESNPDVKAMIDNMKDVGLITGSVGNSLGYLANQINGVDENGQSLNDTIEETEESAESLKDTIKELSTVLDDMQKANKAISDIADNYSKNGFYSTDDMQSLLSLSKEYINVLIDENGQINLNSESFRNYLDAKAKSLILNQVKSLYESIMAMGVEEAQAYANKEAYEAETGSLNDLILATTRLYMIRAQQQDTANNTTVYTDAMKQSFGTVANYMAVYNSWLNSLNSSQNEFTTSTKKSTDALKNQKTALEDEKKAVEDYKKSLDKAQDDLQDLIDLTIDYIKQQKENVKDALEEQKDSYDKANEAKKEAIELLREEQEETEKLTDLQDQSAKDRLSLAIASLDDSSAGKKAQKQAQDKVKSSDKELRNYLRDQSYENQLQALDDERKAFDEAIDNQTKKIDEYLKDERKLYEDACAMIDNDNGELYGKLWNYTYKYTTKTKAEFDHLWSSAQTAIQKYKGDNDTLIGTMEYLQGEIYNTDLKIEDLQTAIDITNQTIDDTSTAIDGVATSLDGLGSSIEEYMDKLNAALSASQGLNDGYSGSNNRWFQVEYNGKAYRTEAKYGDDNAGNRYLAASEITKLIAKDISGFDQYGLGIVQGLLGVGNTKTTSRHKTWFYDYNGRRLYSYANTRGEAVKEIMSKIGTTDPRAGSVISSNIKSYAKGTRNSVGGVSITDENNRYEAKFGKLSSGKYTLMSEGSQVFDAERTDNLYDFSGNPEEFISKLAERGLSLLSGDELSSLGWGRSIDVSQLFSGLFNSPDFVKNLTGVAGATYNNDNSANNNNYTISMPIQIYGNADQSVIQTFNRLIPTFKKEMINELVRIGEKFRR